MVLCNLSPNPCVEGWVPIFVFLGDGRALGRQVHILRVCLRRTAGLFCLPLSLSLCFLITLLTVSPFIHPHYDVLPHWRSRTIGSPDLGLEHTELWAWIDFPFYVNHFSSFVILMESE